VDYWPLDRIGAQDEKPQAGNTPRFSIPRLLLEKVPLLLLSAASAVVTMEVQEAGHAVKDLSLSAFLKVGNHRNLICALSRQALWPA